MNFKQALFFQIFPFQNHSSNFLDFFLVSKFQLFNFHGNDSQSESASHNMAYKGALFDFVKAPRYKNKRVRTRYKYIALPEKNKGAFLSLDNQLNTKTNIMVKGGMVKGCKIHLPRVFLRPMMSMVKDSLFSMLQHMNYFALGKNTRVLDLFCGTGSLGIEALSRGAMFATFVDIDNACCEATSHNLKKMHLSNKFRVIRADAMEILSNPWLMGIDDTIDVAFICPPYEKVVYGELLQNIANSVLFKPNSIIILEYPKELGYLPQIVDNDELIGIKNRKFGRTVVAVYIKRPSIELKLMASKRTKDFRRGREKIPDIDISSPSYSQPE